MGLLEIFTEFKELAENAREAHRDQNMELFDKSIETITQTYWDTFDMTKIIDFIDPTHSDCETGKHKFDNSWYNKLYSKNLNDSYLHARFENLFLHIFLYGNLQDEAIFDKMQQTVVQIINSLVYTDNFYNFRSMMLGLITKINNEDFRKIIPKTFFIDDPDKLIISIKDFLDEQNEFYENSIPLKTDWKNELYVDSELIRREEQGLEEVLLESEIENISEKEFSKEDYKESAAILLKEYIEKENKLFNDEERLFKSCFIEGEPDIEKLKKAAPKSSKAWHMLHKLQGKDYKAWFME